LGVRFIRVANDDVYRNDVEVAEGIYAIIADEQEKA